jgi:hypothetical protein
VWIVTKTRAGNTLELPNQKDRCFLVLIVFKRLFLEHTHKMFGEMPVNTLTEFWSNFWSSILHGVLLDRLLSSAVFSGLLT